MEYESQIESSSRPPPSAAGSHTAPAMEYEQRPAISGRVPRPESRPRRVITRYADGGEVQEWMTESDEESEAEWRSWRLDDVVSRRYEYPDEEDAGRSSQGGADQYEDADMYENDENGGYDVEGSGLGPYGDGTVDPREYL